MKKLSLKDIADMAETSVATVSRVINQNGRFSKETEQRVKSIIEEYGYQPNQLARSLRVNYTKVIGIIVPDITNEFFARIIREAQKVLLEKHYLTLICSSNENYMEARDLIRILTGEKVDGIIYIGEALTGEKVQIPIVYIDRDPKGQGEDIPENYSIIECDNVQGGYLAGHELITKGARNITFVKLRAEMSTTRKRLLGFQQALKEAGMTWRECQESYVEEVSLEAGKRAMESIVKNHPEVDGVFFMSDQLGVGALEYLNNAGICVPEQMKIVGFDDTSISEVCVPKLTTVHQPASEMGKRAAQQVLSLIQGESLIEQRQCLPVTLVVREST